MKKKWIKEILLFLFLFFLTTVFKWDTLSDPHHWDAIQEILYPSLDMVENNFRLIHPFANYGHPPLLPLSLALIWKVFGYSLFLSHLYVLVLASIGLYFTYKLSEHLFDFKVALGATILLFFNQLFFAQMGILNDAISLLSLSVLSVYFYLKKKRILFILFATLAILVKETIVLLIFAFFVHFLISNWAKKRKVEFGVIKKGLFILVPLIPLLFWIIYLKLKLGKVYASGVFYNKPEVIFLFFLNITRHFVYDFTNFNVNKYNFIFFVFLLFGMLKIKEKKTGLIYLLFILIIFFQTALFSNTVGLPRYFVPLLPFFYILGVHSLKVLLLKLKYKDGLYFLIIIICVFLFATNYKGKRRGPGWQLESNLEYRDLLEVHQKAASFIEKKFSDKTVFTCYPMNLELSDKRYGYVSKEIEISTDYYLIEKDLGKDLIVYYSPQSACTEWSNFLNKNLKLIKKFEKNGKYVEIYQL